MNAISYWALQYQKMSFSALWIWLQTLSRYFRISANPLFLAISNLMGIFISVWEQTLTCISPSTSTILVADSTMSPLTLSLTSSRLRSDAQMLHHSLSFLKEYFTYQKSRDDIIRTFLQERQMSLASPPTTSYCFLNSSMLLSNFFWSSKSLEIDSQVSTSEGNLKKQTKTLYFPQLQQQRVRGYDVSGSAREAFSGISNATLNLASLSLKSWQQGCQGSMTSVQSLPMNSSSLRKLSSSVEPKDSFEGYIKEVFFYAFIGQGYPS